MNNHSNHLYDFGKYRLDAEKRVLFRGEQAVHLPLKAIDLLIVLVERHGQVVSKEQLMELLWRDTIVEEANLAQNIFLLRKVFSENGGGRKWIETIPRRGYRFVAKVKEPLPATNPGFASQANNRPEFRADAYGGRKCPSHTAGYPRRQGSLYRNFCKPSHSAEKITIAKPQAAPDFPNCPFIFRGARGNRLSQPFA